MTPRSSAGTTAVVVGAAGGRELVVIGDAVKAPESELGSQIESDTSIPLVLHRRRTYLAPDTGFEGGFKEHKNAV